MSGIFDLFSGTGNSARQHISLGSAVTAKALSPTSLNLRNAAGITGKNIALSRPKPKGLSIRTKSDLNVTSFGVNGARSPSKKSPNKGQYLKTEARSIGCVSRQLSPRGKEKTSKECGKVEKRRGKEFKAPFQGALYCRLNNYKLQALKFKQLKASTSKIRSPDNDSPVGKMEAETNLFRKPFTPRINEKTAKIYHEPEKLANYYEEKDAYSITDNLDEEFVRLMSLSKPPVKPYEDEGFESDPELMTQLSCNVPNDSFEDEITVKTPSLPSLSDDDDDDNDDDFFN